MAKGSKEAKEGKREKSKVWVRKNAHNAFLSANLFFSLFPLLIS
jgi:hypothetical protein